MVVVVLMREYGEKWGDWGYDVRNRHVRGLEVSCVELCILPYLTSPYHFIRPHQSSNVQGKEYDLGRTA